MTSEQIAEPLSALEPFERKWHGTVRAWTYIEVRELLDAARLAALPATPDPRLAVDGLVTDVAAANPATPDVCFVHGLAAVDGRCPECLAAIPATPDVGLREAVQRLVDSGPQWSPHPVIRDRVPLDPVWGKALVAVADLRLALSTEPSHE